MFLFTLCEVVELVVVVLMYCSCGNFGVFRELVFVFVEVGLFVCGEDGMLVVDVVKFYGGVLLVMIEDVIEVCLVRFDEFECATLDRVVVVGEVVFDRVILVQMCLECCLLGNCAELAMLWLDDDDE